MLSRTGKPPHHESLQALRAETLPGTQRMIDTILRGERSVRDLINSSWTSERLWFSAEQTAEPQQQIDAARNRAGGSADGALPTDTAATTTATTATTANTAATTATTANTAAITRENR